MPWLADVRDLLKRLGEAAHLYSNAEGDGAALVAMLKGLDEEEVYDIAKEHQREANRIRQAVTV